LISPSWKSFPTVADLGFPKTCGIAPASATDSESPGACCNPGNDKIISEKPGGWNRGRVPYWRMRSPFFGGESAQAMVAETRPNRQ
jgi:hypothetical protein